MSGAKRYSAKRPSHPDDAHGNHKTKRFFKQHARQAVRHVEKTNMLDEEQLVELILPCTQCGFYDLDTIPQSCKDYPCPELSEYLKDTHQNI